MNMLFLINLCYYIVAGLFGLIFAHARRIDAAELGDPKVTPGIVTFANFFWRSLGILIAIGSTIKIYMLFIK